MKGHQHIQIFIEWHIVKSKSKDFAFFNFLQLNCNQKYAFVVNVIATGLHVFMNIMRILKYTYITVYIDIHRIYTDDKLCLPKYQLLQHQFCDYSFIKGFYA